MIFNLVKHAKQLLFDNSKSKLSATNTQDAIDELNSKVNTLDGEVDAKVTNSFTANRAIYANANGELVASGTITGTELGYLDGVTSNIQTQLNNHGINIDDLKNRFGKVCKTITDWNEVTETGFYMASGAANAPDASSWFMGLVIVHNSNYIIQELWQFTGGDTNHLCAKYVRQKVDNTWRTWHNIPLTYLEGVTSNIQTQLNAKLAKSGGTMTGRLETDRSLGMGLGSGSYAIAPIVINADTANNQAIRSGIGFHNQGKNGTCLYFDLDGALKHVDNSGVNRVLMDSRNFQYDASTQTLNITL